MEIEEFRRLLNAYTPKMVSFDQIHIRDRIERRKFSQEEIVKIIFNSEVFSVEEQKAIRKDERKFKVRFGKSSRFDLVAVLVLGELLYVVTCWPRLKRFNRLRRI